jgi:hypothetical protein
MRKAEVETEVPQKDDFEFEVARGDDPVVEAGNGNNTIFEVEVPEEEEEFDQSQLGKYDPRLDLSRYMFPTLDLLKFYDSDNVEVNREELEENQQMIKRTLEDFGINIASIKATVGPTVTLYEIIPEAGVRISKIKNLVQSILSNISKMPVHYNGSSDIYYKLLEGFSKEAKALLHNEDLDYRLGSKTYDLVTDISEDVWQGDPHLSNAESLESIVDTLLNLTESLQGEDGYSEEGFKEWIGKMLGQSKTAAVTQTKPAPEQSEVERLQSLKKKLQAKLDEKTGDVTISLH